MTKNQIIVAHAQVWLCAFGLVGFLGILFILILAHPTLNDSVEKLLYSLLGVLGTIVTQMVGYFFARQRPVNPAENFTSTTTTSNVTEPTSK